MAKKTTNLIIVFSIFLLIFVVYIASRPRNATFTPIQQKISVDNQQNIVKAKLLSVEGGQYVGSAGYFEGVLQLQDISNSHIYSLFLCSKAWPNLKINSYYNFSLNDLEKARNSHGAETSGCYTGFFESANEQSNPSQNSKKVALEKIIFSSKLPKGGGIPIQECVSDGKTIFVIRYSYVDGGDAIYNSKGNLIVQCSFSMDPNANLPPNPTVCKESHNQCADVYSSTVNKYNIK